MCAASASDNKLSSCATFQALLIQDVNVRGQLLVHGARSTPVERQAEGIACCTIPSTREVGVRQHQIVVDGLSRILEAFGHHLRVCGHILLSDLDRIE